MLKQLLSIALSAAIFMLALSGCKHEPYVVNQGNYPADIASIMVLKCANEGCHDAAGAVNAARLRLDSWGELFNGSSHGAVIVPYSTKYSSLLYYINSEAHSNSDIVALPTMPYNAAPLTEEEYNTVKNWIANGAPDANGNVAFATEADTRQKIYISQQACEDLLTVIDAKSGLVMRYVPLGNSSATEQAHNIKFSTDGRYAYLCFRQGEIIQKIDTRTDEVVGTAPIGSGDWNVLHVSPDGTKILVSDMSNNLLKLVDAGTMAVLNTYAGNFKSAHGLASTPSFDTIYITSQYNNIVYRFIPDDPNEPEPIKAIYIKGTEEIQGTIPGNPNPHEILMSPDHSKFFLTCENTNDVRVVDVRTEQLIATINVGVAPKEMAISAKRNLLLVTCMEDGNNTYSSKARGSVYVIDINTLQQVGSPIYGDFYQPHGIVVDEKHDRIYISSTNTNPNGPAPHHSAFCNGRNGWYSIYNLNTLQPYNNIRYEVTPDPYGADVRFK